MKLANRYTDKILKKKIANLNKFIKKTYFTLHPSDLIPIQSFQITVKTFSS